MSQTIRIEDTTIKALTDRIAELEAVAEEAMACRLFLSDTYHGEAMDRALRAARYLGGGENG